MFKDDNLKRIRNHINSSIGSLKVSSPLSSKKTIRLKQLGSEWVKEEEEDLERLDRIKRLLDLN